jgi:hypothetical protein
MKPIASQPDKFKKRILMQIQKDGRLISLIGSNTDIQSKQKLPLNFSIYYSLNQDFGAGIKIAQTMERKAKGI